MAEKKKPTSPGPPGPDALFERARLLVLQDRFQLAQEELRALLAQDPDHGLAHALLAFCLGRLKRHKEALRECEQGIALAPDHGYPYFIKAGLLGEKAKLKEALGLIAEALRLDPDNPDYLGYKSRLHFNLREWERALQAADEGLRIDPENLECRNALTQALVKMGRKAEAAVHLGRSMQLAPEESATHLQRGFLLLEEGKYDEAASAFEESLRLHPSDPAAREGLARALKTRFPLYAWMLRYFLWTEKLSPGARALLVGGVYFIGQAFRMSLEGDKAPPAGLLVFLAAYLFFLVGIFISEPLFNMMLCLTPAGRKVLGDDRVGKYRWMGGCIGFSLLLLAAAPMAGSMDLVLAAFANLLLLVPIAVTFDCPPGKVRRWMGLYYAFLVLAAAACLLLRSVFHPADLSALDLTTFSLGFLSLLGIFLSFLVRKFLLRRFEGE